MAASVSVIVPAYRASATLDACLDALLDQDFDDSYEVVLVASADTRDELPAVRRDDRLRVDLVVPNLSAAQARNRGVAIATGTLLAFTDADVVVDRRWLRELTAAVRSGGCVAGAVCNGTPRSLVGTAEYLIQFLDLHPRRPPESAWHGATANLIVTRELWDALGPFPEDMGGGEDTLLTVQASRKGCFRFAPDAIVDHRNRTKIGAVLRHQHDFGRFTAPLVRRSPYYKAGFLIARPALVPLAVVGRLVSVYARVVLWEPRLVPRAVLAFPVVLAGLVAWGAGVLSATRVARSRVAS